MHEVHSQMFQLRLLLNIFSEPRRHLINTYHYHQTRCLIHLYNVQGTLFNGAGVEYKYDVLYQLRARRRRQYGILVAPPPWLDVPDTFTECRAALVILTLLYFT